MANATVSQLGQVNASGDANALFLKVFSSNFVLKGFVFILILCLALSQLYKVKTKIINRKV